MRHYALVLLCWVSTLELVRAQTDVSIVSGSPGITDLQTNLLDPLDRLTTALGVDQYSYYAPTGYLGYYLPYLTSIWSSLNNVQGEIQDSNGHLADAVSELQQLLSSAQATQAASASLLSVNQTAFDTSNTPMYLDAFGYPNVTDAYGNPGGYLSTQPFGGVVSMATMATSLELKVQTSKLQEIAESGEDTTEKLEDVCDCIDALAALQQSANTELIAIKTQLQNNSAAEVAELQLICQKLVDLNAAIGALNFNQPATDENGDPVDPPVAPSLDSVPLPVRDDPELVSPTPFNITDPFDFTASYEAIPAHPVGWGGLSLDLENVMMNDPDASKLRDWLTAFLMISLAMFFFMRWGRHFSF